MNTVYRIIWNASLNTWVVASELSSGRRKRKTRSLVLAASLLGCATFASAADAPIETDTATAACLEVADSDNLGEHATTSGCETAEAAAGARIAAVNDVGDYVAVNSTGAVAAATGQDAIGIGSGANAGSRNSVAVGTNTGVTAVGGIAIGNGAQVQKDPDGPAGSGGMFGIAIGEGAKVAMDMNDPDWHYAKAEKAMALGYYANASGEMSVALGANSVADEDKTVSVGSSSLKRRITNVEAGTLSHHAATFGQLEGATTALGGGAGYNGSTGAFIAPTFTFLDDRTFNNVGDALGNLDGRVSELENSAGSEGLVDQDSDTGVIGVGSAVGGDQVNFAGTDGDRRLRGVAEGTADNDAVNLGQLKGVQEDVQANAEGIAENLGRIEGNATDIGQNATDIQANAEAISAHGTAISGLETNVGTNTADIAANLAAIKGHSADIGTNAEAITANTTAISGLDTRVGANTTNIGSIDGRVTALESGAGGDDLVGQDGDTGVIGIGNAVGGSEVNFAGTDGNRRLTGVAEGTADNDAVNLGQLKDVQADVADNAADIADNLGKIEGNTTAIGKNTTDINTNAEAITAHGTAISGLDTRVGANATNISQIDGRVTALESSTGGDDLIGQDADTGVIGVGSAVGGSEVNFAGTDGDRRLTGVADGTADNDAVNLGQLNGVQTDVQTNAEAISGNTAAITEQGGLITGLDGRVTDNSRRIGLLESGAGGDDLVGQDPATGAIGVGAGVGGSEVSFAGTEGDRRLTGVAAGQDDNDAVNVAQLKAVGLVDEGGKVMEAVTYDNDNRADGSRMVSFAGANGTVLNNVADGLIAAGSREAVNGGQLARLRDDMQSQVSGLEDRVNELESGAQEPGPGPGPNPGHGGEGEGSTAIGDGASATGKGATAIGAGASASADGSVAIGEGSVADREGTVSVGSEGAERQITDVAAGTADTDAANVGQMKQANAETLSAAKDYTDQRINDMWSDLGGRIDEVERQANKGIAASAALIMTTPYMPGKVTLNAGVASYQGETALGVGISRWSENGRVNINAGVSAARGDAPLFRVGVGIIFGD